MPLARSTTADPLSVADRRPRVVSVDASVLDAVVVADAPRRRAMGATVIRIDDAVRPLRADVRDAARALLTWLAVVTDHRAPTPVTRSAKQDGGLDRLLRRCVRPGAGVDGLDYTALAEEVAAVTGTRLSAKRLQTAVRHLRAARVELGRASANREGVRGASELLEEVAGYELGGDGLADWRLGVAVLAEVRAAVGRLITHDFAEGVEAGRLPEPGLAARFVERGAGDGVDGWRGDLVRAIERHDGTAEADVRLVLSGAAAVRRLTGAGSLADTVGQLNVAVAGRDLLETRDYLRRMLRVARAADRLSTSAAGRTELQRARRLSDERHRLPSPTRVMSYALNNAATRAMDRVFLGQTPTGRIDGRLRLAAACVGRMRRRDSGFALLKVTAAIHATVAGRQADDGGAADRFWAELDGAGAAELLERLARHESCGPLVDAVYADARRTHPAAADGIIRV
ncbi:MAG: hypothetical protein AAF823_09085 [Planctomycetota bacterium]